MIFRFLEVVKLVLRQKKWDNHFRGVLSFSLCFSCSISLRGFFFSSLGGQIELFSFPFEPEARFFRFFFLV